MVKKGYRPKKVQYYLNIAKEIASRSTCMSTIVGVIIVKDDQIIATGYNGAPRKTKDCYERGFCLRRELNIPSGQNYEICRSVHAEQNAIINAARSGVNIMGADMYMWGMKIWQGANELIDALPCFICKKIVINSGLKNFYYSDSEGKIKKINIERDWVQRWKRKDLLEDIEKYNAGFYKELKKIDKKYSK